MAACEFCDEGLDAQMPENLALFAHLDGNRACSRDYSFMLENLHASWTLAMSGG